MSTKDNNAGAVLLVCLGLVFLWSPSIKGGGQTLSSVRYHSLRVWGVKSSPTVQVIDDAIDRAADREGIPRSLFRALVHVESRKNPNAVSPKGALGLGQVLPTHTRFCGLTSSWQLFDPFNNMNCSAKILRENLDRFATIRDALAVYNAGKPGSKAGQQYAGLVLDAQKRLYAE